MLAALSVTVRSNHVLRRLIVTGCAVRAEGAVLLGKAILSNRNCALSHIDLSRNPLGDRGLLGLIEGLRTLRHTLHVLRLSECHLTHKSLAPLFFAFTDVGGGVLTSGTHDIDISQNNGGAITTNAIINWLRVGAIQNDEETAGDTSPRAKRHAPRVRRLCVDACRLELNRLFDGTVFRGLGGFSALTLVVVVVALIQAPLLTTLEELSCGAARLGVEGARAVRQVPKKKNSLCYFLKTTLLFPVTGCCSCSEKHWIVFVRSRLSIVFGDLSRHRVEPRQARRARSRRVRQSAGRARHGAVAGGAQQDRSRGLAQCARQQTVAGSHSHVTRRLGGAGLQGHQYVSCVVDAVRPA